MTQNQFEAAMTQRQDEGGELSSISGSDGDDDDDDEDNDTVGENYNVIDDLKLRNTKGSVSVCDMWVSAN